ncbi:threonine-phosphate decarboxylase CobD [Halomonas sp.]|jgi:threonine-phosphate decarboxylase|uniref:threonine-phosphate decarboxylase CobD n=1 Tax=Halomonas sp. TaxID=1486246 RepID=UPI00356783C2
MMRDKIGWPSHGGEAAPLLLRHGLPRDLPLLDFSANLNPLGSPAWLAEQLMNALAGVERYPDPTYRRACEAIAEAEGVTPEEVLLTNGGAEAIFLASALHARRRAVIVQPTFSEYARACGQYGLSVSSLELGGEGFELDEREAQRAMAHCEVLFLCRPNNPTGTLVPQLVVERLLAVGLKHGSTLVIDEAFIDFVVPDERLTPLLACYPNLVLLRSLTKYYAIPGLRLGYLLGSADNVACLRELQMPWSVNHLAASLPPFLLADQEFPARTHRWFGAEQPWLQDRLSAVGLRVVPSRTNFFLVQPAAGPGGTDFLFEFLLRSGILARHTRNFPGLEGEWLRLALRDSAENAQLVSVLKEWQDNRERT